LAGRIHAAVVHGPEGRLPEAPVPVLRLHLARWQVGVAVAWRKRPRGLESLLEAGTPVIQRDPAASSQQAFRRALARLDVDLSASGPVAEGHIDAARTAATLGWAAVTTESAARAFGLGFWPLEPHTVEVWVAERWREHPALEALGDLLTSGAFTDRVAQFEGYDLAGCGRRV
jgi:molybdate-binding protein